MKKIIILMLLNSSILFSQSLTNEMVINDTVSVTKNWKEFSDTDSIKTFKITCPELWELRGMTLYDGNGDKVGDILPGVIKIDEGQRYDPNLPSQFDGMFHEEEMLFQEYNTKKYDGHLIVTESIGYIGNKEYGFLYTSEFYFYNGEYAMGLNFLSREFSDENMEFYKRIVETLEFPLEIDK